MNGRRGTSGVSVVPGCPDGSRSVGRPDLHTEAGFLCPPYVGSPPGRGPEGAACSAQERLPQFEQKGIGEVRARLLRAGAQTAGGFFAPILPQINDFAWPVLS